MLKIGNLKLKSNLILAPMSGITDLPYRLLNRKFGCELAFIEMLNVRSLSHKSKKTKQMLSSTKSDSPLGVQLLAKEPKYILNALDVIKKYKFDIIDFNAACPARKVVARSEGAALLKDPKKLKKLLELIVKNSNLPISVKIRTGWDENSINARNVSVMAQDAGVSAIFIHGRTRMQEYSGEVDYKIIRHVKKSVSIPVVASGNVLSVELAKKMFDETGCDGLLVARGALGNPWIFNQIKDFLKNKKPPKPPDIDELIKVMTMHLDSYIDFYPKLMGVLIFRKFFIWYTKGLRNSRAFREPACKAKTRSQMIEVFEGFRKAYNE